MEFLTTLLENSTLPFFTAFVLGLMTAISPCPMATNITAVGFISREIENKNRVFINGLFYTLGRSLTYTIIPVIIFLGADQIRFAGFFQRYGEKFIGPLLVIIGLFMLDLIRISLPGMNRITSRFQEKKRWSYLDATLLGVVFALAFCPYSGVLYFGMLVPMTVTSPAGLYLPLIFAIATGIPVIIFAWIIAYALSGLGDFYNRLKTFEHWFRRGIAILFIAVGIYYIIRVYL